MAMKNFEGVIYIIYIIYSIHFFDLLKVVGKKPNCGLMLIHNGRK